MSVKLSQTRLSARGAKPSAGGRTIYAVGDVHGRADLLETLLQSIEADAVKCGGPERPVLVFLGDYVDRGPGVKKVLDQLCDLQDETRYELRLLKGNHEAAMLAFLRQPESGPTWAAFGGLDTLASYGVPPPLRSTPEAWQQASRALDDALPDRHRALLARLELLAEYGDYLFVHAGVRPGVAPEDQTEDDLLWIRDEFLGWRGSFGRVIVHGHTPEPTPVIARNRIGVDTGAYATGVLTAVRLTDTDQAVIQARARRQALGAPGV